MKIITSTRLEGQLQHQLRRRINRRSLRRAPHPGRHHLGRNRRRTASGNRPRIRRDLRGHFRRASAGRARRGATRTQSLGRASVPAMEFRVDIAPRAQQDLNRIYDWVMSNAPITGLRWFKQFEKQRLSLSNFPSRCPVKYLFFRPSDRRKLMFGTTRPQISRIFHDPRRVFDGLHIRHGSRRTPARAYSAEPALIMASSVTSFIIFGALGSPSLARFFLVVCRYIALLHIQNLKQVAVIVSPRTESFFRRELRE